MNENELIKGIKEILSSEYIGDDCAYLKDLGIVVTQDSLVENIHFDRKLITPFQLGYKSIMVNLSDIAASGAEPTYLTISLSLPKNIAEDYVMEFYKGVKSALKGTNAQIVGGDITGADRLYVSVCAIGKTQNRYISSRKNAKIGHKIITSGVHGSSAAGLRILQNNLTSDKDLINAHLTPIAQLGFARQIAEQIKENYAMMDSSDGLFDALYKIGDASNCTMYIDFNNIEFNPRIKELFSDYRNLIFYGGEDYQIIATVPEDLLSKLRNYIVLGEVIQKEDCIIKLNYNNRIEKINDISNKSFNHFE